MGRSTSVPYTFAKVLNVKTEKLFFVCIQKAESNQFAVRLCGEHTSHFPQLITKKYSIRFFLSIH